MEKKENERAETEPERSHCKTFTVFLPVSLRGPESHLLLNTEC